MVSRADVLCERTVLGEFDNRACLSEMGGACSLGRNGTAGVSPCEEERA
jgi:hypothetical protein